MKTFKDFLIEKTNYEIYHDTYSSAVHTALDYAKKLGFDFSEDDVFHIISVNTKKPSPDQTTRFSLPLSKNDKPSKKNLQVQVYNRNTDKKSFELTVYVL